MKTDLLTNLKNRIGKIAEFDKAIESRKTNAKTRSRKVESPETLLMEKMEEEQRKKEIKVLEDLKKDIKENEVYTQLVDEYKANRQEAEAKIKSMLALCEAAKKEYEETLKGYSREYNDILNKLARLSSEYKEEIYKLGYTEDEIRITFNYNISNNPADIISKERVSI